MNVSNSSFQEGDEVYKVSGDYTFVGIVVSVFQKTQSGAIRYVVENKEGLLHIFSAQQLALKIEFKDAPPA